MKSQRYSASGHNGTSEIDLKIAAGEILLNSLFFFCLMFEFVLSGKGDRKCFLKSGSDETSV